MKQSIEFGFILLVTYTIITFFVGGCGNPTETEKGAIRGQVFLVQDDENLNNNIGVDNSGVTVAVYNVVSIDSSLVRINQAYPSIGVQISQESEFDHRLHDPIATDVTDADGAYIIDNLNTGEYNIVATKEGWSVRYVFSVHVNESSEVILPNILLHEAIYVSQFVADPIVFRTDRMYVFTEDSSIVGDAQIETGCHIIVNPGKTIRFYGTVNCPDDGWWRVDTSYSIYSTDRIVIAPTNYYNALVFYGASCNVKNMLASHGLNAIIISSDFLSLYHCYFKNNGVSMEISHADSNVDNSIFSKGYDIALRAHTMVSPVSVSRSIFFEHSTGISYTSESLLSVDNCYFFHNGRAIDTQLSSGSIQHCEFEKSNYDIVVTASNFNVSYNNFYMSNVYAIVPGSLTLAEQTIVNNNNFYATTNMFISIRSDRPPYSTVYQNLDATNNFWLPNNIDLYLLDAGDNFQYPDTPCPYSIIYLPKRMSRVPNAGIQ